MRARRKLLATGVAALAFVALLTTTRLPTAGAANARCGALAGNYDAQNPPHYTHVVVLMEENWSYSSFVSSTAAPFLAQLARDCGNETNFHAATHPSQPNYMAATSGYATGVGVHTSNNNVFNQTGNSGRTWRAYEESMPAACYDSETTLYKPGHNPPVWYTDLRSPTNTCARYDVPLAPALTNAIANDALPAYSWISPNKCHAFYWDTGCATAQSARIRVGDDWLSNWLPKLTAMPSYRAGKTLIIVTFDEGLVGSAQNGVDCTQPSYYSAHPDCHIPTVVVSPYIQPGRTDGNDHNLYTLLGTTEDILGLPRLGRAGGAGSMRPGLRF